jgi:A/G-specific adenine glycosylase
LHGPEPAQYPNLRRALLAWYRRAARDLPWRKNPDPYRVWIAEVMLQQTRVAAVAPYYERFLKRFPDVKKLAAASRAQVLAAWAGLGYYRRAQQLHEAARRIVKAGGFPRDYAGWRALPGVGEYTAAAIASIVLGEPRAVLDGNVLRVLSRLVAESGEIERSDTRRRLGELAERLLDRRDPGRFNQALMELGATVCLPKAPLCASCPLASWCAARWHGIQADLPRRARRPQRTTVERTLLWVERGGRLLLCPCDGGRLEGFWELPDSEAIRAKGAGEVLAELRHAITRYDYRIRVVRAQTDGTPSGCRWVSFDQLDELPLSTVTRKAMEAVRGRQRAAASR